jgi:hypothetical protein
MNETLKKTVGSLLLAYALVASMILLFKTTLGL